MGGAVRRRVRRRYPEIRVHLTLDDRFADIVGEGLDIAIRGGPVIDSGLTGRRLFETRRSWSRARPIWNAGVCRRARRIWGRMSAWCSTPASISRRNGASAAVPRRGASGCRARSPRRAQNCRSSGRSPGSGWRRNPGGRWRVTSRRAGSSRCSTISSRTGDLLRDPPGRPRAIPQGRAFVDELATTLKGIPS